MQSLLTLVGNLCFVVFCLSLVVCNRPPNPKSLFAREQQLCDYLFYLSI